MKKLLLILICIIISNFIYSETLVIKRSLANVREGKGPYYKVITILKKGDKVEVIKKDNDWFEVKINDKSGWISSQSFIEEKKNDVFANTIIEKNQTKITSSVVTAAIKGFSQKYIAKNKMKKINNIDFTDYALNYSLNTEFYYNYINYIYKDETKRSYYKNRYNLDKIYLPYSDISIGLGSGQTLVSSYKLIDDPDLLNYLNSVGANIAENCEAFDYEFKFFILNDNNINAYAFPGGIIFVTLGALKIIENESQLAVFLAHEICHSAHRHGIKEIEKRKDIITAESGFIELSESTPEDEDFDDVENELSDIASEIYEEIVQPRTEKYEIEADQYGLIYSYRCGYNVMEMLNLLDNLEYHSQKIKNKNDFNWINLNFQKRKIRVKNFIQNNFSKGYKDYIINDNKYFNKFKQKLANY